MKITRRSALAAALAPAILAQAPPEPAPPADLLAAAKEQNKRNAASLDKIAMPMSTEPAFAFKA